MDYRMPLYVQLQDIILKKIEEKKYLPGEAIPSERKLAELYGVNRMTVKRAIDKLVDQGYLERKKGSGTFVSKKDTKKIDLNYGSENGNTGLTAQFKEIGVSVNNKVFGLGQTKESNYLKYRLGLTKDDVVWGIHRVRIGDGNPFAVEYTYVPKKFFEDIDDFDFSKVSLYDYMDAKGRMPIHFTQKLIICEANEKIAELLDVEKGAAIFRVEYQGADENYNIVEYTKSYLNPKFSTFRFLAKSN